MLAVVLRLEAASWPGAMRAYSAALLALATRCERAPAKGEIYRWFMRVAGGALMAADEERRECLRDAFHDAVVRIPGILLRWRSGLKPSRSPNLRSMLVAWIRWRGTAVYRARRRHASRHVRLVDHDRVAPGRPDRATELREVLALLDGANPRQRALLLVAEGHTIASAARLTGVTRQTIYRIRAEFRALIEG